MVIYTGNKFNYVSVNTGKSMINFFQWHVRISDAENPLFAYVQIGFIRFMKNRTTISFGLCFGKYFIDINFNH